MSDRISTTARGKGKQQQEAALLELKRFILGQVGQLPPEVQQDNILEDISRIVDDELITSLEAVLEVALFMHPDGLEPEQLTEFWPTKHLLNKLKDLQKARLRDALELTVRFGQS